MRFGKKQPLRKYIHSKFGIAVLLLMVAFFGRSVYERYTIEHDMAGRRVAAETELEALTERKSSLKADVEYLEGERGIEEEIRSNFDVARAGEQVVILVGEEPIATSTPQPAIEPVKVPWWKFWR